MNQEIGKMLVEAILLMVGYLIFLTHFTNKKTPDLGGQPGRRESREPAGFDKWQVFDIYVSFTVTEFRAEILINELGEAFQCGLAVK